MSCSPGTWFRSASVPHQFLALVSNSNRSARLQSETVVPADILLVHGTCIVNEAMLSGESTPLLKESIQLLDTSDKIDADGAHKNEVLFSGTKVLQASPTSEYPVLDIYI